MTRNQAELTYLRAEVRNASSVRLVIILYDLLIAALGGAIKAITNNDAEERSRELQRAFLVIEQMEGSLDMEAGGNAAENLARFYATLRRNIMIAHAQASAALLEKQIRLLLQVRGAWVKVDGQDSIATVTIPSTDGEVDKDRSQLATNWTA